MDKKIQILIDDLKNIFKDRLLSVVLYGSAASNEFHSDISDINLIVMLDKLSASDLNTAYPAIKKWQKTKNPLPLFMDRDEWFNSSDVYAIECSDIKQRHRILYGENLVDQIEVEKCNLRLQSESELRNLLIKLRQAYLGNSQDKKSLEKLIKKSSTSYIAVFRAVLRILDIDVPEKHRDVIKTLADKANFDKDVFFDILTSREQKKSFSGKELENTIQRLIDSLNQVLKYIDGLEITC